MSNEHISRHLRITAPSPWVERWTHLVKDGGTVLDLAAGGGRHGRLFLDRGCAVTMVDKNVEALEDLQSRAEVIEANLEDGSPWPLSELTFDAVIVVNYLYRDLFDNIIASLKPGGVLIYETFARGNEDFARPRNPDHLLKSGELLDAVHDRLQVVAYEHGLVKTTDISGVKQRLVAVNDLKGTSREDGEPEPHLTHQ
ncbi:class I SAM-dependent methyltransferase [Pseudomonadota bacterium]